MIKVLGITFAAALLLSACKQTAVSDFCKQIETIGEDRLLRKYTGTELIALKLDRKRALLALRRAYDANCTNSPN